MREPRPDWSSLGVNFKILDEHPYLFYISSPAPRVLELHGYDALNLLSCMTLDVENMHSVVHHKDALCAVLDYARNFGNAAKESQRGSQENIPLGGLPFYKS